MPTRIDQHEIEDISRARFKLALPRRWVFRNKDNDYGIDGEVELFDDSKKAQGLVFWAQLKATESQEESTIMNVDLKIDRLRYYQSLNIPVLLVRYSDFDQSIFIKWISNVDLFFAKENAKTFRIKLAENDRWNDSSAKEIERRLTDIRKLESGLFRFPIPLSLDIREEQINGFTKGILVSQIRKHLQNYSDFVSYSKTESESVIVVRLDHEELKINLCDVWGCFFHSIDLRSKENFSDGIAKDIILGIAISMIQLGQVEYCGRMIFGNNLESRLLEQKELLKYCLTPLFQSSYFEKILDLVSLILDNTESIELDLITRVNLLFGSESKNDSKNKAIEKFLLNRLQRSIQTQDDTQIGISHYNLGNHYRGKSANLKAINHYLSAKRFTSIYLKQPYFFSELAGVLFLSERYEIASKLYYKSIKLGNSVFTKALYADALMFAGDYEKAKLAFFDYIENAESPKEEFHLKGICLESILKEYGIKKQKRKAEKATKLADLSNLKDGVNPIAQLEKALELDLLSGLAWFNLGITHNDNSEFSQACFCFTMAALVQKNDIEAWKNATLCAFNSKTELMIIPLILRTAFFFNREDFLESLYSQLEEQNKSGSINEIIEMIEKVLPEQQKADKLPTVRVLNEKGQFENIFEKVKGHNKG